MADRETYPRVMRAIACATLVLFTWSDLSLAQAPPPGSAPPTAPATGQAATDQQPFSQEQLDQLVAPIALYPDELFAQVLMAATYPLDVVQADRWVKANPNVKDQALQDALEKQPWDPSVKGLAVVPQVLAMMSEKLDWTQKLGDAFLAQKEQVMATAQALRAKAQTQGSLKDSKEQKVITTTENNTTIIKIEPANPEVIYVPTYNPTVVYGAWPYPAYPPYYYYPPGYVAGAALIGFTAGAIIGGAIWGGCNWGRGDVNVNVNRYNNFNRTNVSNGNWNHNADRRGAVPYRDQKTAQQFNRGQSPGAGARDSYRGREGGAQAGNRAGGAQNFDRGGAQAANRGGGAQSFDRGGGAGARSTAFDSGSRAQTQQSSNRGASSMNSARSNGGGGGARAGGGGGGARGGGGGGRGGGGRR